MCIAQLVSLTIIVHGYAGAPSVRAFPRRPGTFDLESFEKAVNVSMGVVYKDDRLHAGEGIYE
jgi:hypothetical protein